MNPSTKEEVMFSDTASAAGYLRNIKEDLVKNGEFYSNSELQTMRDHLKDAYSQCKLKKDASLLSDYRSSLAKIDRFKYHAQMTEGRDLEEIIDDNTTNEYQKLNLTRTWFSQREYSGISSNEKLALAEKAYTGLSSIFEGKEHITFGEKKAYDLTMKKLDALSNRDHNVVHLRNSEFSGEDSTPEHKGVLDQFAGYCRKTAWVAGFLVAVVTAAITLPVDVNRASPISPVQTAYTAPVKAVIKYEPILQSPLPEIKPILAEQKDLAPGVYEVQEGDNLWTIGEDFYGDPFQGIDLGKVHGITDPTKLKVGTLLNIGEERIVAKNKKDAQFKI
jgi:hypothetical protein